MADAIVPQDYPTSRKAAQTAGSKHYFTGKPCKLGHISLRYTSIGKCLECSKVETAKWREENPEKLRESWRRQHEKHGEKRREYHREYMKNNPEMNRANVARWKKENPEKVAVNSARYREKYPEEIKERLRAYHKKNPHMGAASARRRRARLRGAEGSHTGAEIIALGKLQKWKCACCGKSIKDGYDADHIVPLAKGGSNYISNIQLLCETCNRRKAAKDPIEWANQIGRLL